MCIQCVSKMPSNARVMLPHLVLCCRPRGYGDGHKKERRCLFLGTERTSVIFVFDITDPTKPVFQSVARPPQPDKNNIATRLTAPEGMTYER
jgi:hypothetical protein